VNGFPGWDSGRRGKDFRLAEHGGFGKGGRDADDGSEYSELELSHAAPYPELLLAQY
jgi:hypothetical protein